MDVAKYREAEERLWHFFGLEPAEQTVVLPTTGTDVRVQVFGSIFGSPMDNIPLIMRVGSLRPIAKAMARRRS